MASARTASRRASVASIIRNVSALFIGLASGIYCDLHSKTSWMREIGLGSSNLIRPLQAESGNSSKLMP